MTSRRTPYVRKTSTTAPAVALLVLLASACGSGSDSTKAADDGTAVASKVSDVAAKASSAAPSLPSDLSSSIASASTSLDSAVSSASTQLGDLKKCPLPYNGATSDMVAVKLSCEDVSKIWEKYSGKDETTSTGEVEYDGTTYECATASMNGYIAIACHSDEKSFAGRAKA